MRVCGGSVGVVTVEEPEEPAFRVGDDDGRDVVGVHAAGEVVQVFVGAHVDGPARTASPAGASPSPASAD